MMVGVIMGLSNPEPWTEWAACGGHPEADIFHPDPRACAREAKSICAGCPVRVQCLDYALRTDQRHGVWGALSEIERRRIPRHADGQKIAQERSEAALRAYRDHGTEAGARRHYRRGEKPCESCRVAHARMKSERDSRRARTGRA